MFRCVDFALDGFCKRDVAEFAGDQGQKKRRDCSLSSISVVISGLQYDILLFLRDAFLGEAR